MILIDSDVLLIEHRYQQDPKFAVNHQALQEIQGAGLVLGVTSQVLLEVTGILSFNVPAALVTSLHMDLISRYNLQVIPDLASNPNYACCSIQEIVDQMAQHMGLGDAVQAVQIALFGTAAQCLLTWNARHFVGKVNVPVLTPQDWLNQRTTGTP